MDDFSFLSKFTADHTFLHDAIRDDYTGDMKQYSEKLNNYFVIRYIKVPQKIATTPFQIFDSINRGIPYYPGTYAQSLLAIKGYIDVNESVRLVPDISVPDSAIIVAILLAKKYSSYLLTTVKFEKVKERIINFLRLNVTGDSISNGRFKDMIPFKICNPKEALDLLKTSDPIYEEISKELEWNEIEEASTKEEKEKETST